MLSSIMKILPKNEALVYNYLICNGLSKPTDISIRTRVPRNKVYDSLYGLEAKGLVVSENSSTKSYSALEPKKILELAKTNYDEKKKILVELEEIYPKLKLGYESNKLPQPYFSYTRGVKDIVKEIKEEIKHTKEFVYIFARKMTFFEENNLINVYHHLIKRGVEIKIITLDDVQTKAIARRIGAKAIFLPKNMIPKRTFVIKDDLFAISLYGEHEGIRMKTHSPELVDAFKSLFLLYWNSYRINTPNQKR